MSTILYPQNARIFGAAGQSGTDYHNSRVRIDGSGDSSSIAMRPRSVNPSLGYNDMMPDDDCVGSWIDKSCKASEDGSYTPPPRGRERGFMNKLLDDAVEKGKERNREFRSEGNNGLTVVYQISKFKWSRASADRVRDRVYALIADRTRVARQPVIDETETMFNYEMIVEIEFKKASIIKQFEELVRKTGASVGEVK